MATALQHETPVETPERSRERIVALRASRVANIKRLIRKLEWLVLSDSLNRPDLEWRELEALDAATHVWPDADDLHHLLADAMHDLGMDPEGYPITDEGDRNWNADRQYTPMQREG